MLTASTRIRVQSIIHRLKNNQSVSLEERIYLSKLSKDSSLVSAWLYSSISKEAKSIDDFIA
tara:strand:+ start:332 stop:517 length:186 start_codon:yes stop_codon:yes gene_type:complete